MKTMTKTTQIGLLVAALIGGAIAAAATRSTPKPHTDRHSPEAVTELTTDVRQQEPAAAEAPVLQGKVLEVIQVSNYTYLRFEPEPGHSVWAAVNSSPGLKVGDSARVGQAQLMQKFHSASLKRDFESIYFGVLEPAVAADKSSVGDAPANPHSAGEMGASAAGAVNPHARIQMETSGIDIGRVPPARGGHRIAEMYAAKSALAGKTVRVRAVVVKSTPDVMGKTFAHVRDGSGTEANQDFDLTVTTQEKPQVRQSLLLEGRLEVNVDLGAGYKYPLILQDARVVNE